MRKSRNICTGKRVEALYSEKKNGGMGFRDLHCFNMDMLAKQIWRLLSEPDSFNARVLRAKYYTDGRLLNAKMKSGNSYTWCVLSGLECFKKKAIFGK